jgi:branched-chain amino acid transport system permease protein
MSLNSVLAGSSKTRRPLSPAFVVFALLAAVPLASTWIGTTYYLTLVSRIMILGMAAMGLNLILGFGGLVSLGHALYIGVGAYAVGILARYGIADLGSHLVITIVLSSVIAGGVGWVSLRTRGLGFIMITMAFGQMFYFLAVSLKIYGGDEGLVISSRSLVAGTHLLDQPTVFYYVVFAILTAITGVIHILTTSPFGLVLSGARQNEQRLKTLGYSLLGYRLTAYVISATITGIAGCLLANLTRFSSPEYMSWTLSGTLVVMIVLGGLSTTTGPLVGAVVILLLEEIFSSWTDHWMVIVGPLIVAIVLFATKGVYGALANGRGTDL